VFIKVMVNVQKGQWINGFTEMLGV